MGKGKRNKTNKMHFIPKVYLRKWFGKKSKSKHLYCYNYKNKEFHKSWNREELGLNDKLFQDNRIYSQQFESELKSIENHYNDWLNDIDEFFNHIKSDPNRTYIQIKSDKRFWELYDQFHRACLRMSYFCFVQWIRYPMIKLRFYLFHIFKELMLEDKTDYMELNASECIKTNDGRILSINYKDDKQVFRNPFRFLNREKLLEFKNSKYQIFVDHSTKGEFVTSTMPVTPLFSEDNISPYGLMFPLSPNYVLKIAEKEPFLNYPDEEFFPCQWTFCNDYDEKRMNITLFGNNTIDGKIICGDKQTALKVFSGINMDTVVEVQNLTEDKAKQFYQQMHKGVKILDLSHVDESF